MAIELLNLIICRQFVIWRCISISYPGVYAGCFGKGGGGGGGGGMLGVTIFGSYFVDATNHYITCIGLVGGGGWGGNVYLISRTEHAVLS